MDDLRTLGAALAPDEPPQDVVDRSRHRLQNHMRGHHPIRRRSWLAITAAAAATVAVGVAAFVALPADPPRAPSGQDILFAAAAAAERSPESVGIYWYYRVEADSSNYEYWIRPDGYYWHRFEDGKVEQMPDRLRHPFRMAGIPVTLDQLRALPTDPDALRARVDEIVGDRDEGYREQKTLDALVSVVSVLPAPPEVRAAAFRAIAAYPEVEYLGKVPGGQGVRLPAAGVLAHAVGDDRPVGDLLVVDPVTGRVNGTTIYVNMTGETHVVGYPGARITAEWTDNLPA